MNEPLLTRLEAQKILRVSRSTMFRLIHKGDLPATRIGRTYRIRKTDLESYLEKQMNQKEN